MDFRLDPNQHDQLAAFECHSEEWNHVIWSLKGCDAYDTAEYHQLATQGRGFSPRLFLFQKENFRIALPMALRPIDSQLCNRQGWIDASSVYGFSGPLSNTDNLPERVRTAFQRALTADLLRLGVVSVFSRLNPFRPHDTLLDGLGNVSDAGTVVAIDLTCGDDERFAGYRRNHRQGISRLRNLHIATTHDDKFSHLNEFNALYLENMVRVGARPFYHFDNDYFESLTRLMPSYTYLFFNEIDNKIASGALFLNAGDIVHAHLTATNQNFRNLSPLKKLIDDAASFFRNRGCQLLHLGGGTGSRSDSLFHFKTGFSRSQHRFKTWKWIVDRARYESLASVQNGMSNSEYIGHFPCYRSIDDLV